MGTCTTAAPAGAGNVRAFEGSTRGIRPTTSALPPHSRAIAQINIAQRQEGVERSLRAPKGTKPWTLAQPDVSGRDVSSRATNSASFRHRGRVTWSKVRARAIREEAGGQEDLR